MNRIQYTLRNIPAPVDRILKQRAKKSGKSFNQTVIDSLAKETGAGSKPNEYHDLDWFIGSKNLDGDAFDIAQKEQRQIDPKLWL